MAKINSKINNPNGGRKVFINAPSRPATVSVNDGISGGGGEEPPPSGFITANRIAEWFLDEGSGQKAYNEVDAAADDNLISVPENHFNNYTGFFTLFTKDTCTVTDNFAENPWGEASKAARIVTDAGTSGLRITISLSAGTHTVSLYVKSNTGSEQTMRMEAPSGGNSSDITVPLTWTRVSFTFTATAGNNVVKFVKNSAAGTALDILVDGLKINTGASATDYVRPKFDLTFGYTAATDSNDPSWVSGKGISITGSHFAQGITADPQSLSTITAYVVAKLDKDQSIQAYVLREVYNDNKFWIKWGYGGTAATVQVPQFRFSTSNQSVSTCKMADNVIHCMTCSYDGTYMRIYVDTALVHERNVGALSAVEIQRLMLSSNATLGEYFRGTIYYASVFSAAHTFEQIQQQFTALQGLMTSRSETLSLPDTYVLFEGDSISSVLSNGLWPRYCMQSFADAIPHSDCLAIVGSTVGANSSVTPSLNNRAETVDARYDASRTNNILVVLIGANDLGTSVTVADYLTRLKAYCNARRAVGWKVVLCTILPRTATDFLTKRAEANADIISDTSFYDAIARFDQITNMGADGDELNTTYYPDGTHPSAAGHALLAPVAKAAIESVIV